MPELQDPPAAETKPQSPFAAALDKAFKGEGEKAAATEAQPKDSPAEPPKKEEKPKVEKSAVEQKATTPRDLFKSKPEVKDGELAQAAEPKSAFDEIKPPEFKDEKGKQGWEALKTEAKSWETKAKQLEREAAERKTSGRDTESLEAKLAETQGKLKEYDEIVSRARLDDHPAFRAEFVDGRQKIVDHAKTIIEESDGDPKAIEIALNLKGKARAEALREASKDLDSYQAARLGRAVDELTALDERAQSKRDAAKKSYDEIREQERQRSIEESATKSKRRGVEFEQVSRRLTNELEVLKQAEGFDDWNTRAKRIISESRAHVEANPGADIEAEILSRAVGAYRDLFVESDRKAEELEKKLSERDAELKSIYSKSPSLTPRGASPSAAGDSKRPFSEAFARQAGQ